MICNKCKCNAVVDICPLCGEPYINDATKKYLDELQQKKESLDTRRYNFSGNKKRKEMRTKAFNHSLEPWNQ